MKGVDDSTYLRVQFGKVHMAVQRAQSKENGFYGTMYLPTALFALKDQGACSVAMWLH